MQLPILIEPIADGRFRAQIGDPFDASAEGDDPQRALEALVLLVKRRLQNGATIAALTMSNGEVKASHPPIPADDAYKTDWTYQALVDEMAENRRLEETVGP